VAPATSHWWRVKRVGGKKIAWKKKSMLPDGTYQ